jgi:hypothetical protein
VQGRSLTAEFMLGLRHGDRKALWCLCRCEVLPWRGVPCLPPGARSGCLRHECLAARFNGVDIEVRLSRQQPRPCVLRVVWGSSKCWARHAASWLAGPASGRQSPSTVDDVLLHVEARASHRAVWSSTVMLQISKHPRAVHAAGTGIFSQHRLQTRPRALHRRHGRSGEHCGRPWRRIKGNLRQDARAGFSVFETSSILAAPNGDMQCCLTPAQHQQARPGRRSSASSASCQRVLGGPGLR